MPDDWLRRTRYGFWLDARHWFQRGQRVTVARGPYAGYTGVLGHLVAQMHVDERWETIAGYALRDLTPPGPSGGTHASVAWGDLLGARMMTDAEFAHSAVEVHQRRQREARMKPVGPYDMDGITGRGYRRAV